MLGMPAGYDIRHVALSPNGEHVAWLAAPAPVAKEGGSVVWVFETATGKLLHTVKGLPRSYRTGLPDDGKTLSAIGVLWIAAACAAQNGKLLDARGERK